MSLWEPRIHYKSAYHSIFVCITPHRRGLVHWGTPLYIGFPNTRGFQTGWQSECYLKEQIATTNIHPSPVREAPHPLVPGMTKSGYRCDSPLPVPGPTTSRLGDSAMASASRSRRPSSVCSMEDMCRSPKPSGQLPHTSRRVTLRSKAPAAHRGRLIVRMCPQPAGGSLCLHHCFPHTRAPFRSSTGWMQAGTPQITYVQGRTKQLVPLDQSADLQKMTPRHRVSGLQTAS